MMTVYIQAQILHIWILQVGELMWTLGGYQHSYPAYYLVYIFTKNDELFIARQDG